MEGRELLIGMEDKEKKVRVIKRKGKKEKKD